MKVDLDKLEVTNNEEKSRFEALAEGYLSTVEYRRRGDTIIFDHTKVPEELSGNGIANKLAKTVLDYSRAEGLKVVPLCPFILSYLKRHTEYQDVVRGDYQSQVAGQ